ncbi:hypothetical protein Glove_395g7 [Diversispora epigaea]|uniref:Phospholipid scramblase n=1 Tax=Diversispora epigaea TaxID=1348612 RepID=A0A397H1M0_9GLOM|nr:hypothetical protein Glove_395g7 [Diversispora epigaea]
MLFNILRGNNYSSSRNLQILLNPIFITFLHKTPKRSFSTKSIQGITEKTRNLLSNIRNNRGPGASRITRNLPRILIENPNNNVNNKTNIEKASVVSQPQQQPQVVVQNNNKPYEILTFSDSASQILQNSALIVARQVELLNVFLGFEQANKYQILDENQNCVGYIAEEQTFTSTLLRQLLRTHRNFRATILNPKGEIILKIHRPFAFINSRIFVSTNDGQLIGEVQQQWHLWRRRYNLFNKNIQFGKIDAGFLSWDFHIQDKKGVDVGSVNRNFGGFAKEIFTDMGQYVIRIDPETRPMSLDERAVILAAAISVDFDYFSRHSRHGGGGLFHLPILDDLQGRNSSDNDDVDAKEEVEEEEIFIDDDDYDDNGYDYGYDDNDDFDYFHDDD